LLGDRRSHRAWTTAPLPPSHRPQCEGPARLTRNTRHPLTFNPDSLVETNPAESIDFPPLPTDFSSSKKFSIFVFAVRIRSVYKEKTKGGEQMKIKVNVRAGGKTRV
jgi:hypothetical protein